MRPKVTVIGAHGAGAAIAQRIAGEKLADVVILDLEGRASRELLSRLDACGVRVLPPGDFLETAHSQVCLLTAGDTPEPDGPDEERLIRNEETVRKCVAQVTRHSRDLTIIVGTEPSDVMCEVARRVSKLPGKRIIGLPREAERRRMKALMARSQDRFPSRGSSGGVAGSQQEGIADEQAVAATEIVDAVLNGKRTIHACASYLEGEYGLEGIFAVVPAEVGKNGIEKVIELPLSQEESTQLRESAAGVAKLLLKLTC